MRCKRATSARPKMFFLKRINLPRRMTGNRISPVVFRMNDLLSDFYKLATSCEIVRPGEDVKVEERKLGDSARDGHAMSRRRHPSLIQNRSSANMTPHPIRQYPRAILDGNRVWTRSARRLVAPVDPFFNYTVRLNIWQRTYRQNRPSNVFSARIITYLVESTHLTGWPPYAVGRSLK